MSDSSCILGFCPHRLAPAHDCQAVFFNETRLDGPSQDNLLLDRGVGWLVSVLVCAAYLPVMYFIWRWRNRQAVYFKSPMLILVGGTGLWLDSLANIGLNTNFGWQTERRKNYLICIFSILTTFGVHYIGYLCIILRAVRIFKVMQLEKRYLDKMFTIAKDGGVSPGLSMRDGHDLLGSSGKRFHDGGEECHSSPLSARRFKKRLQKNEDWKEKELKECEEIHYVKLLAKIITALVLFGFVMYLIKPFVIFLPLYRGDSCLYVQMYYRTKSVTVAKGLLTMSRISFQIFNWIEIALLYYIWRKLNRINQDQLNIKKEMAYATAFWWSFSIIYFFLSSEDYGPLNHHAYGLQLCILIGIQLRNLSTFYAQTLFTLYKVLYELEIDFNSDERINAKLQIMNLENIMTHPILYSKFRKYTIKKFSHYVVYMNLYQLIEIYRSKVINLHMMARALKKRTQEQGLRFDPRNGNDPQY